jgi:hypothetical protein
VLELDGLSGITQLLDDATSAAVKKLATAALMGLTLDEAAKVAIVETAGRRLAELVNCPVRADANTSLELYYLKWVI